MQLSSLRWAILVLFHVFFIQWRMFPSVYFCPKMYLCTKRVSKIIVPPKELKVPLRLIRGRKSISMTRSILFLIVHLAPQFKWDIYNFLTNFCYSIHVLHNGPFNNQQSDRLDHLNTKVCYSDPHSKMKSSVKNKMLKFLNWVAWCELDHLERCPRRPWLHQRRDLKRGGWKKGLKYVWCQVVRAYVSGHVL